MSTVGDVMERLVVPMKVQRGTDMVCSKLRSSQSAGIFSQTKEYGNRT